jgi:hypothetical protein
VSADKSPPIDRALVDEFALVAHRDLEAVRRLLDQEPALVNCARDWGGGDWETALGAAAHVGRSEIALYRLDRGALV